MAKVFHAEIYGLREAKYDWLNKHNIKNVKWNKLEPQSEFYLFIPQDRRMHKAYQTFEKITDVFTKYSLGIFTHRDWFLTDFNYKSLSNRINIFKNSKNEIEAKALFNLKDTRDWKIKTALSLLKNEDLIIRKYAFRPFDERYVCYNQSMYDRGCSRYSLFLGVLLEDEMLSINTSRIVQRQSNFTDVLISNQLTDAHYSTGGNYVFPIYVYPNLDNKDLFSEHETGEKKPNIKPELFEMLNKNYSTSPFSSLSLPRRGIEGEVTVTPEEIFYYIYAVLYSNTYRTKYAEFLKIDFPRVPFTKDYKLFIQLGKLGKQLADLHLLKSKELEKTISKFPIDGSNKVEKPRFYNGKVWINKEQYFDSVKEEVWQYQIGGYQVCEKWLKDRKERTLTLDEIKTYCKIVTALSITIDLQKEIDKYFEEVEKTL